MFDRPHHQRIAKVLESLEAGLLKEHNCLFAGGTANDSQASLMKISISKVKVNLSKFVNMAYYGESILILKNNIPFVDIAPHHVEKKRTLGLLRRVGS